MAAFTPTVIRPAAPATVFAVASALLRAVASPALTLITGALTSTPVVSIRA